MRAARLGGNLDDRGCELSPSCLDCTEEVCKFDRPGYYEEARQRLTPRVVALRRQGQTFGQIALHVGVSSPTARSWWNKAQEEKVA